MVSPLFQYQIGGFDLYVFGQQESLKVDPRPSYELALSLGALRGKIAQIVTASGPKDTGHKQVYPANYKSILNADGIVLREVGSAGIIMVADCAAGFLLDAETGDGSLVHMGRPALDPTLNECQHCGYTVIDNALDALNRSQHPQSVQALVTGNICGSCFKHERSDAEKHVAYCRRLPGVFADEANGSLDLFKVIVHNLTHYGVKRENITHEGPCTFETPSLSSYRRGDMTRNAIIAIKRH